MTKLLLDVDDSILKEAKMILDSVGLDIDIAFNIFIKRIIKEKGLPFSLKQTNVMKQQFNSTINDHSDNVVHSKPRRTNNTITNSMIEEVWSAFIIYNEGSQEISDLKEYISEKSGMSVGSAQIYLNILVRLSKGEINKRSMKPADFEFFLKKFKHDLGIEVYNKAIHSVEISIPYWNDNIPTFARSMKELLKRI